MRLKLTTEDRERFEAKVYRIPGGCRVWLGSTNPKSYGWFGVAGRVLFAHRVAWVLAGNEITPDKPCVLHNCPGGDDPACVNPDHLWTGTVADNQRDMARKGRGRVSESGLPFGVFVQGNGRFGARIRVGGERLHLGTYDTAEEASAVAFAAKDDHIPREDS